MNLRLKCSIFCFAAALQTVALGQEAQTDIRASIWNAFPGSYQAIADTYDSTAVPELILMLSDEAEERYWSRAAAVLGVIGDERAVEALIEFIERPGEDVFISQDHLDARSEAIRRIG